MFADKPFWTRVALWGVGLFLVTSLLIAIAGLISDLELLAFAAITAVPALIAGAAIAFWRKWGLLVGFIVSILGFVFFGEGIPTGITLPDSFFDFATNLFGVFGLLLMFIGCGIGFWQSIKGTLRMDDNPTVVTAVKGVLGVVVVLSVISAILTVLALNSVSAEDEEGAEILFAEKVEWDRDSISVSANGTTKIVVKNKDPFVHTFTVKDLDIDVKIGGFQEKLVEINSPGSGEHFFICDITGHEDMAGSLQAR